MKKWWKLGTAIGILVLVLLALTVWLMETQGRWAGVAIGFLWVWSFIIGIFFGIGFWLYRIYRK